MKLPRFIRYLNLPVTSKCWSKNTFVIGILGIMLMLLTSIRAQAADKSAPPATNAVAPMTPVTRLTLDGRLYAQREKDNVEIVLAPCKKYPDLPLKLDGRRIWTLNNMGATIYRDPQSGEYRGWYNKYFPDPEEKSGLYPIRSKDGITWQTAGPESHEMVIIYDDTDPDPNRRYKAIAVGSTILNDNGRLISSDQTAEYERAKAAGAKPFRGGMVSATSPDGCKWQNFNLIAAATTNRWRIGMPGWAGGDSIPGLLYAPSLRRYVAFYRTNIDRSNSIYPGPMRRERGVGRSESKDFINWTPHELVFNLNPTWQRKMGYETQDIYEIQVWPCQDVFLGIIAVFYWKEDQVHLELCWSSDTFHWERLCPGTDIVPQGQKGEPDWGCNFPAMRPIEVGDDVRVYYGGADGGHNADNMRKSGLCLATFQRDRFAGIAPKGMTKGSFVTTPLKLSGGKISLNADAQGGEIRAAIRQPDGTPLKGFSLADCSPVKTDSLAAGLAWKGDLKSLAGREVTMEFQLRAARLYSITY